jgi:hypothetical protein
VEHTDLFARLGWRQASQLLLSPSSEAEAHANGRINVAVLEEAEAQPAMHLVEHHTKIEIPLWGKSPIRCGRNRIVRPGALRMRAAQAEGRPAGRGAEKGILDIEIVGADHIQFARDGVFRTGPHDLQGLVAKAVHTMGRIVDIRVVEGLAPLTKKGSGDIREGGLGITGCGISNVLVTGLRLEWPGRVLGYEHRGRIV